VVVDQDSVRSYMGFRTIEKQKIKDIPRPLLNGEFVFQMGVLDQGYWPDGIYTAPHEMAFDYELDQLKQAGFNMLRKHVKVEPAQFYHACDRLGIMVIQDMPSMPAVPSERVPTPAEYEEYGNQLAAIVKQHLSHPSIVTWVSKVLF
jgi:beta-galactosidase/beta-glucuronidase